MNNWELLNNSSQRTNTRLSSHLNELVEQQWTNHCLRTSGAASQQLRGVQRRSCVACLPAIRFRGSCDSRTWAASPSSTPGQWGRLGYLRCSVGKLDPMFSSLLDIETSNCLRPLGALDEMVLHLRNRDSYRFFARQNLGIHQWMISIHGFSGW